MRPDHDFPPQTNAERQAAHLARRRVANIRYIKFPANEFTVGMIEKLCDHHKIGREQLFENLVTDAFAVYLSQIKASEQIE